MNIPVKPLVPRPPIRNSIEGLNQEIERLVLKSNGAQDTEREEEKVGMYFLFKLVSQVVILRSLLTQSVRSNLNPHSLYLCEVMNVTEKVTESNPEVKNNQKNNKHIRNCDGTKLFPI